MRSRRPVVCETLSLSIEGLRTTITTNLFLNQRDGPTVEEPTRHVLRHSVLKIFPLGRSNI